MIEAQGEVSTMALPPSVHEQMAQREARLRLVPVDETPPPEETREQVQRWQQHVHEVAETIRWADATTEQLAGLPEADAAECDRVLTVVRAVRAQALAVMQQINPDQAWFWTEEWQAGEREVDRNIVAGELLTFATDEEFTAYLLAGRPDIADV
jgi:hypothetical protein